jgi:GNAT superfamily N-acetyltransferase
MKIRIADKTHSIYANIICDTIEESANVRGTGIARRTTDYVISKMKSGNAVIALENNEFAGFCYIETWEGKTFVANSGLIVHPNFRGQGLAKKIKKEIFELSRKKYPNSKIFSITTGLAVLKMNTDLGYKPVTFSELTKDETFWNGCQTCKNFDVLQRTEQKMCLCTGMLFDPKKKKTRYSKSKKFISIKSIREKLQLKKIKE